MLGHLERLLEQVAADPGAPLSRLALMRRGRARPVVEEWSRADAAYPAGCIHELFAAQARATPDAVAVRARGRAASTYRAAGRAPPTGWRTTCARAAASAPEVRRRIVLERAPELSSRMLAVLKAGGAYVPLDPAYPAERLAACCRRRACGLVIAPARSPRGCRATRAAGVWTRRAGGGTPSPRRRGRPARLQLDPGELAYVIYTSGSTGWPKGGGGAPRRVANALATWMGERLGGRASRGRLQSPRSRSTRGVAAAVAAGARLAGSIVPRDGARGRSPADLWRDIAAPRG